MDNWESDESPIRMDKEGNFLNGQHRLRLVHEHEGWQIREDDDHHLYCAACGEPVERCHSRGDGLHEWSQCKKPLGHPGDAPADDYHEDEEGYTWW